MIITISREYGAGGHSIGKSVAEELGIEFYDRDIIKATVAESDQQDTVRTIEQHVIVNLAMKGPCVILGRCADEIMAKANIPSLDVFLYASDIHRAARIGKLIGSTNPTEIQKKMQKTDAARRTYYEQFTGKHWGDSRNYTLSLDTGFLGYDTCVKLICEAARRADALA